MKKGVFIVFEGSDAAGKTTQAHLLQKKLVELGYETVLTREPGGTDIGDQIRNILHDTVNQVMCAETEFLLFSASRAQHVQQVIGNALTKGKVVLCDRFWPSSIAYQGYGRGLPLEQLMRITEFACGSYLKPNLIIYIDLTQEALNKRLFKRRDEGGDYNRLDQVKMDFRERVRQGYLDMIRKEPERWSFFDGDQTAEELHQQIVNYLVPKLTRHFAQ